MSAMHWRQQFLAVTVVWAALSLLTISTAGAAGARQSRQLERPDDPPGIPALPVPGAPLAQRITFGHFVSIQTNVAPDGSNIPGDAANEPSIAVDPTFPNRMAIGWRQFDSIASNFREAGYAYSTDGGRTWTFPGVLEEGVFRSDPVLDFDAEGNFYYNSLASDSTFAFFDCEVFKSTNGGKTWGAPVYAWGGDKQWMTIDRSGGIGHGHVYCNWQIGGSCCGTDLFTRSVDGAASFEVPVDMPGSPRFGTLDVAPDGVLYMLGIESVPTQNAAFLMSRSSNAQDALSTPTFDTTRVDMGGNMTIGQVPNPAGLLGQAWIKVDPTNGFIYALCSVDPPGADPLDVYFSRSEDGGATWLAAPVRVNDDPTNNGAWQWFGTMSVSPDGRIDAVWNDSRNTAADTLSELYYSFSTDGGTTWSPNQQLSPEWDSHLGWPRQNKIGDYYEMISDRVGAHLAWAATFNGEQDVYYLRIGDYDCNSNGVGDSLDIAGDPSLDGNDNGIIDECELEPAIELALDIKPGSCPNPFNTKLFEPAPNARARKGGVIPVAVLGSADFDVHDIDVASLLLEGVAPIRYNYADVSTPVPDVDSCQCTTEEADGFVDLTLKFEARDIAAAIPPGLAGENRTLTLTGELLDGTPIEARDCIEFVSGERAVVTLEPPPGPILSSAFPNPFNPVTTIGYVLPEEGFVRLTIFDVGGRLVKRIVSERQPAGEYAVEWRAGEVPSGVYFYHLEVDDFSTTRKMILLK